MPDEIQEIPSEETKPATAIPTHNGSSLPLYQCHKIVRAALIVGISTQALALQLPDGSQTSEVVRPEWLRKHNPKEGGYLVIYEDGYKSFSPAAAFESGYVKIESPVEEPPALGGASAEEPIQLPADEGIPL